MTNPMPMQVGGPVIVAASATRRLAVTGGHGIRFLVQMGTGLVVLGAALVRRGRATTIQPGHPMQ